MGCEYRGIAQAGSRDLDVIVLSIHRFRPGIMPRARHPVLVLGMSRIEPKIQAERLIVLFM